MKFIQIKERGPNFCGERILQKVWIIWSPLLYFIIKSFKDRNCSSFNRFQCILHDSGVLFSRSWNFYKLKSGNLISGGGLILQKVWIISSPFVYFNFKSFKGPKSLPFIRFQCILFDKVVSYSDFWKFYKLKRGKLISGRNQFWRKSGLFGLPFCISILKASRTQSLCHSLYFNALCIIQEYFSQSVEISTN